MSEAIEEIPTGTLVQKRDWVGSLLGLAIFLGGIYILYVVFSQAFNLFQTPPKVELKLQSGKPLDVASAFNAVVGVATRVLLLILMAWVGSMVANRGVHLYSQSKPGRKS
jgi:ATP/ADP translocase